MEGDERRRVPAGTVPQLDAATLLRTAANSLRTEPARVLVPAVVVFGVSGVADTLVVEFDRSLTSWSGVLVIVLQAFSSLGLTFYAGLLDRLVGAAGQGAPAPTVGSVILTLPYARLVVADLVLWLLVLVTTATLVVPGMVLLTLLSIVGPLINMEDHGVVAAFRHSARLVWPQFGLVFLMVTLPLAVEHELVAVLEDSVSSSGFAVFLVEFGVGLLFGTTVGLVEVSIAELLMRRRRLGALAGQPIPDEPR